MKHPIYKDDVVDVQIELVEDIPFIHVNVLKWSVKNYKHLIRVFIFIKDMLEYYEQNFIYAMIDEEDTKLQHFASMFGFMPLEQVVGDKPMYRYWRV